MSTDRQLEWYAKNIDLRGAFCVDVGANVGVVSQFFFEHGDDATRVLSVEPIGANVDAVQRRIDAAAAGDRWTVLRGAVSDATGRITLRTRHDERDGWNATVSANPPPTDHLEVDGWRLPELAPEATIVKLDVEGHEYRILDDALAKMPTVRAWAVELHMIASRSLASVLEQFVGAGFEVIAATRVRGDPKGPWYSVRVPVGLGWEKVPVARRRPDGSVFKMLHVLARRPVP